MTPTALALLALVGGSAIAAEPPADGPPFRKLANDDAWRMLPRQNPRLPNWARMLAESLPRTTAAMIELDYVHRAKNPLGPILAGKVRWAAADALGCDYLREYAEADLKRAGLPASDLKLLGGDPRELSRNDRLLLTFARRLSKEASKISDAEVAELVERFGPELVVGVVHTVAHANFQGRIFLALGVEVEPGGPLPPLGVAFDPAARVEPAKRPPWKEVAAAEPAVSEDRPDWLGQSFAAVQKALDAQKARTPRVPLPDPAALAKLPPEARESVGKIVWSQVSMGYQPLLTKAWFDTMRTFQREASLDRVFGNTYFWVVTRTNDCFY